MPYKINKGCIFCTACIDKCTLKAIYEGNESAMINEELCLDCGACARVCPLNLIVQDETMESKKIKISSEQHLEIMAEKCIGCSLCKRFCPEGAIEGILKKPFVLDSTKCIKCGICLTKCTRQGIKIC